VTFRHAGGFPGGTSREVEILLSPDDWSSLYGTIWGELEGGAQQVKEALDELPDDHPFLIYKTYELHPSETETLPEDPDEARMREFMRDHPEGGGDRFAIDRQTNLPFPELPPEK